MQAGVIQSTLGIELSEIVLTVVICSRYADSVELLSLAIYSGRATCKLLMVNTEPALAKGRWLGLLLRRRDTKARRLHS